MNSSLDFSLGLLQASAVRGLDITPLKLQKLMYYCQGYSLVLFDEVCFSEQMQAWDHGPVCCTVYNHFKPFRSSTIKIDLSIDYLAKLGEKITRVIDFVLNEYGAIPAVQLRNMTHNELPWKSVYKKGESNPIPCDLLISEFQAVKTNRRLLDVLDSMQDDEDIEIPVEITNSDQFIAWIRS